MPICERLKKEMSEKEKRIRDYGSLEKQLAKEGQHVASLIIRRMKKEEGKGIDTLRKMRVAFRCRK